LKFAWKWSVPRDWSDPCDCYPQPRADDAAAWSLEGTLALAATISWKSSRSLSPRGPIASSCFTHRRGHSDARSGASWARLGRLARPKRGNAVKLEIKRAATLRNGSGRARTRTCSGTVEWRSRAPDVPAPLARSLPLRTESISAGEGLAGRSMWPRCL
jgi:hypothetical protein